MLVTDRFHLRHRGDVLSPTYAKSYDVAYNAKVLTEMLRKTPFDVLIRQRETSADDSTLVMYLGIGEPVLFSPARRQGMHTIYFSTVRDGRFVSLTDWTKWAGS